MDQPTNNNDIPESPYLIRDPRPWAFSQSELTAGLRRHTGDPKLEITTLSEVEYPKKRPSIGRVRCLNVNCRGTQAYTFQLVHKEPIGTTRVGTAGVGKREVSFYRSLADQIPVRTPKLLAGHPNGDWLILESLPPSGDPETWHAQDYRLAIDQLTTLHDRFWGLGEDLMIYNWLAQPLDNDFEVYVKAAKAGVERLLANPDPSILVKDNQIKQLFSQIVSGAEQIIASLQAAPKTLLHGDYWPGNIHRHPDGTLTLFDWQQVGIGPGVLDLVTFVQSSRWWFGTLPLSEGEIISHYRSNLSQVTGQSWEEEPWALHWDSALLWTFLVHWIHLLAIIPTSLIETRFDQLEATWFKPLQAAISRVILEA